VTVNKSDAIHKIERSKLSNKEACAYLQRAEITLKKWREKGIGPPFTKDGMGRIWYAKEDLDAFLNGGADE
jgi:hypothetical protein